MKSVNDGAKNKVLDILLSNTEEIQSQLSIYNTSHSEERIRFIEMLLKVQDSNMTLYKLLTTEVTQDDSFAVDAAFNNIAIDIHSSTLSDTQKHMVIGIVERALYE